MTLVQTGKTRRIPIILAGADFRAGLRDWFRDTLVAAGTFDVRAMGRIQVRDQPK